MKKLALACESYGTRTQMGAIRQGAINSKWFVRCFQSPTGRFERMLAWKPDAVIDDILDEEVSRTLRKTCKRKGIPVVNITWDQSPKQSCKSIAFNSKTIGKLAAEHLLSIGLTRFAFIGHPRSEYSRLRLAGFQERLKAEKFPVNTFLDDRLFIDAATPPIYADENEDALVDWLKTLKAPTGIFAANDRQAYIAMEIALYRNADLCSKHPIIGADNDPFYCKAARPQLSSVPAPMELLGETAVKVLDDLFEGTQKYEKLTLIAPDPVIARESSYLRETVDPFITKALKYIDENLNSKCTVAGMAKYLDTNAVTLHSKFKDVLRRTPLEEIHRRKFANVECLLRETEMAIDDISEKCGFRHVSRFCNSFKKRYNETPTDFRNRLRTHTVST
jgi:LacI family transcriptional regulator